MEHSILYRGNPVGSIEILSQGLYHELTADCSVFAPGVQRLYQSIGYDSFPMGVLLPEAGRLRLQKKLSKHAFPSFSQYWTAGAEDEGFLPWRGSVDGVEVEHGFVKCDGEDRIIAVAFPSDAPFPLSSFLPDMEARELFGQQYLCLRISGGMPVRRKDAPEESETGETGEEPSREESEID